MNLQTELAPQHKSGLLLRNPVMTAAGTFGYGVEYAKIAEIHRLGAIVCKGTTLLPRSGNEHPRTHETASGLLNAMTGLGIDIRARRPVLAHGTGGLSGPAVKPIALRMVYDVACELRASHPNVPVIGIGGIANAGDALEFLMAGASAIQVGTINFVNPRAGVEIVEGIEAFLKREGVASIEEIVGSAL